MPAAFKDLCIDATAHQALADWWCAALGYVRSVPPDAGRPAGWPIPIEDPIGAGPKMWVNPVREPKTVKNRLHIDVVGDVDELVALAAMLLRGPIQGCDWSVLADPEGNELGVFAPKA